MTSYKVASDEGAQRYGVEVGEQVDLDLSDEQERALLAAGWLEAHKPPQKKKEE